MTNPMIRIYNAETQEVIDREMTDQEFDLYEIKQAERLAKLEADAQKAVAKADLLSKLGITDDEAKLLLS
jgi:hypothetical protein